MYKTHDTSCSFSRTSLVEVFHDSSPAEARVAVAFMDIFVVVIFVVVVQGMALKVEDLVDGWP
jgi:hypothetical protein